MRVDGGFNGLLQRCQASELKEKTFDPVLFCVAVKTRSLNRRLSLTLKKIFIMGK